MNQPPLAADKFLRNLPSQILVQRLNPLRSASSKLTPNVGTGSLFAERGVVFRLKNNHNCLLSEILNSFLDELQN